MHGVAYTFLKNHSFGISHPELVSGSQARVEIYNVLGEQVYSRSAAADDNTIDLSAQPNGVYLYRVIGENSNLIGEGKLVIEK